MTALKAAMKTLQTSRKGTFSYRAASGQPSRTIRLRYPGTPTVRHTFDPSAEETLFFPRLVGG